jgi:hypothetical protein
MQTVNCLTEADEVLGTAWVGWFGDPASPLPVNNVYYIHVWWGITGNTCIGGARVAPKLFLPEGTTLAISTSNPVRCILHKFVTKEVIPEVPACPQAPASGVRGGLGFYPVGQPYATWPSAQGTGWEIQIPVLSTGNLDGGLTGGVWMIDGLESPWGFPRVGVKVEGPTGPTIS